MEIKYLNTFRCIVEEGSFTKAAAKLNYTQSTITFQVGQLEQELSARLFEKIGRNMVLTHAGQQLIPYVDDVLNSLDKMRYFGNELSEYKGDLHIGAAESVLCYRLPAVLKEFHRQAPNAQLYIQSMNCYDIRDELLEGTLDLGVFYEDVGGFGTSITTYPLDTVSLSLVASPDFKKKHPDFISGDRKLPVAFIINEKNCIFRQIFENYLREKSIILDHTIELWSIPTIKSLVKNDVGISYLPDFTIVDELKTGELETIKTDLTDAKITAVCGCHKNKWISPLMQLFMDLCRKLL